MGFPPDCGFAWEEANRFHRTRIGMDDMLVSWNDHDTLGNDIVDRGHHLVIEAINCLNAAISPSDCHAATSRWLPVLTTELTRQFGHEAAVMTMSRHCARAEHEAEHARFMDVLATLAEDFAKGEDVSAVLLLNLVCFLGSHLRGTDHDTFAPPQALAA
jgi:hemerythrin-like metal-binding protein